MREFVPLGDVVEIRGGGTPSRAVDEYWDGAIPWATVKDFKSTVIESTLECITGEGVRSSATNIIPAGAIIVPTRMAVGKAAINKVDLAINQDLKALLPKKDVDANFLLHFLLSQAAYLESRAQGATVKGIKLDLLRSLSFPRLSLNEQRRIAAILDKAEGIRRKQEIALATADEFLRSVFLQMFGDPRLNNYGLKEVPLGKLMQKITDGEHQNPTFAPEGMPIVMANQVLLDRVKLDETKFVSFQDGERFRKKCGPARNDILIVGRGATIGRCCLVDTEIKFCLMGSVILLKPNRDIVSPFYLLSFLQYPAIQQQLVHTSSSSAQQAIYLSHLKQMPVPVPEYTKQKKYENIANRVLESRSRIQQGANEAELVFRALSQCAFRGEL